MLCSAHTLECADSEGKGRTDLYSTMCPSTTAMVGMRRVPLSRWQFSSEVFSERLKTLLNPKWSEKNAIIFAIVCRVSRTWDF